MKRLLIILSIIPALCSAQVYDLDAYEVTTNDAQVWDVGNYLSVSGGSEVLSNYTYYMQFWSGNFDFDNNLWLDKSGNGNDLQLVSSNCLNVDSLHYISKSGIPSNLKFTLDSSFSISFKIRVTELTPVWQGIISIGRLDNGITVGMNYSAGFSYLRFYVGNSTNNISLSTTINTDTTYSVILSYSPYNASKFKLYLNGQDYTNYYRTTINTTTPTLTYAIDNIEIGDLVGYNFRLDGEISDVRICNDTINPNILRTITPLYWWPMSEGYGNYVHEVVNRERYSITNDGLWAKQDSFHYNLEKYATQIVYNSDTAYVPYDINGDTIYDAVYIATNGNYLNAAETTSEGISLNGTFPPVETKFQIKDTLIDHNNYWYTAGVKNQIGFNDIYQNWEYRNYQMSDSTLTGRTNFVIWNTAMHDPDYLAVRSFFNIPLIYNDIYVESEGGGDFTTVKAANNSISDASSLNRYRIYFNDEISEKDIVPKSYTSFIGNDSSTAILNSINIDAIDSATLVNTETFLLTTQNAVYLENLTCTMTNGRYPLHIEGWTYNPTAKPLYYNFKNCRFIHNGNYGSRSSSGKDYWSRKNGVGIGLTDNMRIDISYSILETSDSVATNNAYNNGLYIHSKIIAGQRSIVNINNSNIITISPQTTSYYFGEIYDNNDTITFTNVIQSIKP